MNGDKNQTNGAPEGAESFSNAMESTFQANEQTILEQEQIIQEKEQAIQKKEQATLELDQDIQEKGNQIEAILNLRIYRRYATVFMTSLLVVAAFSVVDIPFLSRFIYVPSEIGSAAVYGAVYLMIGLLIPAERIVKMMSGDDQGG